MSSSDFRPDWVSPPGSTIVDILRERKISEAEFAQRMGQSIESTEELLQGRATITIGIARQLHRILGASMEFWIARDAQYRSDTARIHKVDQDWLKEIPVGDMIKFGWIAPAPQPSHEVAACLHFFNVSSVKEWRSVYGNIQQDYAFRTSSTFDSHLGSVAAWIRQGEIKASAMETKNWDAGRFKQSLPYIRSLTRYKDPQHFLPKLQKCCAENGVAVIVVRAPMGCRASGATKFLSPDKALLLLSFRYLTDDHFWFSFFHEAGHLLLHGQQAAFIEGLDIIPSKQEDEANEFATQTLIPAEYVTELLRLRTTTKDIIRFAVQSGVSPGIVVGQLQHLGRLKFNQLNKLKRRYTWDE